MGSKDKKEKKGSSDLSEIITTQKRMARQLMDFGEELKSINSKCDELVKLIKEQRP